MNNYQLKYKEEIIWTKDNIGTAIQLLIIGQINDIESDFSENIILKIDSSFEWNLNKLVVNVDECLMISYFDKVKSKLISKPDYYSSNEFAHKLYPLLKQSFNKKEISKLLTKLSINRGKDILKIISKILRVSRGKLMFETVEVSSTKELTGEWKSIKMEDSPEYGFNFNMTDLSPSYGEIKIVIKDNNYINIIIPARDYTNPEITEFSLITGKCEINEGHLIVSENDWIRKIPILCFDSEIMELYLFRTNITLKKTHANNI